MWSRLVATVIESAVIPTMIANSFFMPTHLLPSDAQPEEVKPWPAEVGKKDAIRREVVAEPGD